jgi:4-carboxymuconolactone decarboxylase
VNEDELRDITRKTAEMLFDPELARHISMFFTGRLYAREVISQKQRELCAIAALTVMQRLDELRVHVHAALNVGASKEEIAEVMFQMLTYGGVPTTVEGLKVCKEVLQERGLWDQD